MIQRLLINGGDDRLLLDEGGLNQYFVPPYHSEDYIIRSSSTCNMISGEAFDSLKNNCDPFVKKNKDILHHKVLTEEVKHDILECLGIDNSEVYINLTPSGTDSEILLTFLSCLQGKLLHNTHRILNFIPSGTEVGRGMGLASDLRYFSKTTPSGRFVNKGEPILGTSGFQIKNVTIPFRNDCGQMSDDQEVEKSIFADTDKFLSSNSGIVVLRVVSYSKTGLEMPKLHFAEDLKQRYPGRVIVAVNTIQMRCRIHQIKQCLEAGMVVSLSGSKFFGGPPFSGALLLPKAEFSFFEEFALNQPVGFRDLFSLNFLDDSLLDSSDSHFWDFSLLFRWKAALYEMKRYLALQESQRNESISSWYNQVIDLPTESVEFLPLKVSHNGGASGLENTILPFHLYRKDNNLFSHSELQNVHKWMSMDLSAFLPDEEAEIVSIPILVGQPVKLCDEKSVLRIALSTPQIVDINQHGIEDQLVKDRIVLKKLALISKYYDLLLTQDCQKPAVKNVTQMDSSIS